MPPPQCGTATATKVLAVRVHVSNARIQGVAASVCVSACVCVCVCVLLPWRGYCQEQPRYPSHSTSSSSPVQRMIKVCRQQLSPIPRVCYCDVSLHWPRHRLTETGPVLTGWMNGHFPPAHFPLEHSPLQFRTPRTFLSPTSWRSAAISAHYAPRPRMLHNVT